MTNDNGHTDLILGKGPVEYLNLEPTLAIKEDADRLQAAADTYMSGLFVWRVIRTEHEKQPADTFKIAYWYYMTNTSVYGFASPPSNDLAQLFTDETRLVMEVQSMNIFGSKLFPYISGEMLADKGLVTLTIKDVKEEPVTSQRGTDEKPIVYFGERDKGLILNKTNAKSIAALYGAETDEWIGKKIGLFAEAGTWFGKPGHAVRIADRIPTNGAQPKSTTVSQSEPPWDEELAESQNEDEPKPLQYRNGTKVDMSKEKELSAFNAHVINEGMVPPSRAALVRWANGDQIQDEVAEAVALFDEEE